MKKRDHKKEIEEVRETLTFFHESKNEPTSILVVRIFVHPENHKEYWENCDGFLKMIEGIFNYKIKEDVENDNIHVHLSTSFSINCQFDVSVFTINLIFVNHELTNLPVQKILTHLTYRVKEVTDIHPELHYYPFEVFVSLIDESNKPIRDENEFENHNGMLGEESVFWLNQISKESFKTDLNGLLNIRGSELGRKIKQIEIESKTDRIFWKS